jgi:hypothetical protein
LAIFPVLMQLVQTRIRLGAPFTKALTACKFTFQRRRLTLCAWEMLLPNCGPLPQMSHTCAMVQLRILGVSRGPCRSLLCILHRYLSKLLTEQLRWAQKARHPSACRNFSIYSTDRNANPDSELGWQGRCKGQRIWNFLHVQWTGSPELLSSGAVRCQHALTTTVFTSPDSPDAT